MTRFSLLLACWLICLGPATFGFPAAKPKEPPTNAELIVGVWELVLLDGKAPPEARFFELSRDRHWHRFSVPGGNDKENGRYEVDGAKLIIFRSSAAEKEEFRIDSLNAQKLVIQDGKVLVELKRR